MKDIADLNHIPSQFLAQIFSLLGKADIVTSVRGKSGGYRLSRNPEDISVMEILEILEGELEFAEKGGDADSALADLFHGAEAALRKALSVSLADLLEVQRQKSQVLTYEI